MTQIQEELIKPNVGARLPIFICGDFGTSHMVEKCPNHDGKLSMRESSDYAFMLHCFHAENGRGYRVTLDDNKCRNDLATDNSGRVAELDYILLRKGNAPLRGEWDRVIFRKEGWDRKARHNDLSYRYAVMAAFAFPSGSAR
jgi:hypothetical protein